MTGTGPTPACGAPSAGARAAIAAARAGHLPAAEAEAMAAGLADGSVSDAQAAAFATAVLMGGIGPPGAAALTRAMTGSGRVLDWDLPGPVLDKHSTGGVGDVTSLIVAPLVAACGGFVPMISGRGLGHTGGTLDKLEAIPGFRTDLDTPALRDVVSRTGAAIVAATADLAPADRRLYAIRDEIGMIDSIELITASILSKKLAAGVGGLVLDVKCGSGAFMRTDTDAARLAEALVRTAAASGCRAAALITDMDQPLARAAGNAVEVAAALTVLRGEPGEDALRDLSLTLAAECLRLGGLAGDDALERVSAALASGQAADRFARMVAAQGGPADVLTCALPQARVIRDIPAPTGRVQRVDAAALGQAVVDLGGGRRRAGDAIDHTVGLSALRRVAEATCGTLGRVHAASDGAADAAIAAVQAAYVIADPAVQTPPVGGRFP